MKSALRDYQQNAIAQLRQSLHCGARRPVMVLPTGAGKTVIAAAIVEMARNKGNRVVFCAPAVSLIDQTVQAFYEEGIEDIGVIQADHPLTDWSKPVQIASVQTLERREKKPDCQLVIVDECHKIFRFMTDWMADSEWKNTPFIGLSATPWARGLGKHFDDLIVAATTADLIEKKYLSPFRVFAPAHPDLSAVNTVAGDYHAGQLGEAMNSEAIVADIVSTWQRLGEGRPTLCFGVDRAHAKSIQEDFRAAGIECDYVDAFTDPADRAAVKRRFEDGHVKVVSSVGCLTTGVDWDVRCIIMARPTKSEMLFVQMIGRGLRTAPGKEDLIILDHADNHSRLGFVTDIHHEELDSGRTREKSMPREKAAALPKECSNCTFLMPAKIRQCPNCGVERAKASEVETLEGELAEMRQAGERGKAKAKSLTIDDKQRWYSSLLGIAKERGYKSGWAANQYREKFKVWPANSLMSAPIDPAPEVRSWVKSRQIAYAKRREKGVRHAAA